MIITRRFFSVRTFLVLALALILSVATYGFAANNTVDASSAGDGSAAVSGYTVSNVKYVLDTAEPGLIDSVTFSITLAAGQTVPGTVKVQFQDASAVGVAPWYTCTGTSPNYTCTAGASKAPVKTTTNLRVVAAQ